MSLSEAYVAEDGRIRQRPDKAYQIGKLNEERAVSALMKTRPSRLPGWFRRARRATQWEDHVCKIDVILVSCDRGNFAVQIKSSIRSVRRWMNKPHRRDIVCVALLDTDTFDSIRRKIISALEGLRAERKNKRRKRILQKTHPRNRRRR